MNKKNLATTMRIEIQPEDLLGGPREDTKKQFTVRRRNGRRVSAGGKTESSRIGGIRHAIINDPNFQELFQSVYDAAIITDPVGNILDANTRAEEFFAVTRSEISSHNVLILISGADETLIETLRKNLESDRFTLIEAFCRRFDGTLFPSEISVNRLHLTGKDYLCFFVRDITVRRETEEMFRTVHKAIHNAGNGIAITDMNGTLEYANPATARLWGLDDENEILQSRIQDLLAGQFDFATMTENVKEHDSWSATLEAQRSDGQTIPLQLSVTANRDADERLAGMIFSFEDVSDKLRVEEMERAAEKNRIMLESIGAACHHLGQPATVLLASLGMMQQHETGINDEMRVLLRQGVESAEKLREILHRLNRINDYRTVEYLEGETGTDPEADRILEL